MSSASPKVVAPGEVPAMQGYCGVFWEIVDKRNCAIEKLNLALVRIDVGLAAQPHYHQSTEEVYYILEGEGQVGVGSLVRSVSQGYALFVPPSYIHTIRNIGSIPLLLLVANSPPYDASDTFFPDQASVNGQ